MTGHRAPELPRIPGLDQIIDETIVFLLETVPVPSSTQDDAVSQLGAISSQQTSFQASSSQQTVLGSRQQKPPCDGSKATIATVTADASLEGSKSNLELVEPMIDRSEGKLQKLANYSGQAAALQQVKIAIELPRLVHVPSYIEDLKKMDGILLHGPPGTGKTFITRVLASRAGVTTFKASPSSIMSRYVGDGEK